MKSILLLSLFLVASGCASKQDSAHKKSPQVMLTTKGLKAQQSGLSTLWVQKSAEYRALAYQAFALAKMRLDRDLRRKDSPKKRAIIVDIDETILDNSPYQGFALKNSTGYPVGWKKWIDMAQAKAIAGAVEFLNYAHKKGVVIYYISNRKVRGLDATYKNLKKVGAPVEKDKLLLRSKTSSKIKRRSLVRKNHRIVLMMGDNLGDFSGKFDKKSVSERSRLVDAFKRQFGKNYIVLPNPIYGDWLGAVIDFNYRMPDKNYLEKIEDNIDSF